jgi:FkbM family methyltransferase
MIINKQYITERINTLLIEKEQYSTDVNRKNHKLGLLKNRFPLWFRKFLFSWRNPIFCMWKIRKQSVNMENSVRIPAGQRFAVNFMEYFLNNDVYFDTDIFFLKEDLPVVVDYIDNRIKSILSIDNNKISVNQSNTYSIVRSIQQKIQKQKNIYILDYEYTRYYLPKNCFTSYIFDNHYGLKQLSKTITDYITGKDILDIGACIGDSAILFLQYSPARIFAYEPASNNYKDLLETISLNNASDKIIPVKKGLGAKEEVLNINVNFSSSSLIYVTAGETEQISISTIDNECKDMHVGLIKMDVEGFEYFVVKGGERTIKRDKPLLLISVYHTARDFFEIPPMLQSFVSEYKFRLLDINPLDTIGEKILLAYL